MSSPSSRRNATARMSSRATWAGSPATSTTRPRRCTPGPPTRPRLRRHRRRPRARWAATTDLAGGWFDAGDFLKFSHTTAYADALLWATQRELGAAAPDDARCPEARFGLDWLAKAWHPDTGVHGPPGGHRVRATARAPTSGDHDMWRLPEVDDGLTGDANRYLAHRPAFAANAPGAPVPPNLAGRIAAAFAPGGAGDRSHRSRHGRRRTSEPRRAGVRCRQDPGRPARRMWSRHCPTRSTRSPRGATTWPGAPRSWRSRPRRWATRGPIRWLAAGARWATEYLATEAGAGHAQPVRHERAGDGRPGAGDARGDRARAGASREEDPAGRHPGPARPGRGARGGRIPSARASTYRRVRCACRTPSG